VVGDPGDETYYDKPRKRQSTGFDAELLREPLLVLPVKLPIVMRGTDTVTDAMRAMQREHTSCVLVTSDGSKDNKLQGIFTERDVLFRIVDKGRNPASLPIEEVMTSDPEALSIHSTVAYVLNKMAVGGFRHVPVVDDDFRPAYVIAVRDVVSFLVDAFPREVLNLPTEPGGPSQGAREGA
jgi:CBS domain-containing protein